MNYFFLYLVICFVPVQVVDTYFVNATISLPS